MASPLLSRLYRDLAELRDVPYPGVAVFIDDANITKFCLVLTPPSGPWKDLALHFDVELPSNWPSSPPRVACTVADIEHPNLFGNWICCDLLKEESYAERGYTGGYSPALTLRGLFLQFLTFFSSTKVEQDYGGDAVVIGDFIMTTFKTENDTAGLLTTCCRHRLPCSCAVEEEKQVELERLWRADPSPEFVVSQYMTKSGVVTHKTKGAEPRADRIHQLERQNPLWARTLNLISSFQCKACPYGSPELPHHSTVQPMQDVVSAPRPLLPHPIRCYLDDLSDDVLYVLALNLQSESLLSFCTAYPRLQHVVDAMHILLQRELRCFFLRTSLLESTMGVGVAFNPGPRIFSSDFDWLSKEAFTNYEVRKSIEKREFQYFLPLAFSPAHFAKVVNEIWISLMEMDKIASHAEADSRKANRTTSTIPPPPSTKEDAVRVIYKMMNNIVVSLMRSCEDVMDTSTSSRSSSRQTLLHASEKAVISYCHLFHLLLCLCRANPRILLDATNRLRLFIQNPSTRVKSHVPDIGELIVLVTLVLTMPPVGDGPPITWQTLNGPFLQEAIIRNVRWVLKDSPELEVMEEGPNEYRLAQTFFRSKTSLRLIMFQITFQDVFTQTYASNLGLLDDNYGFAERSMPERMVGEVKAIFAVSAWPKFFERVKYARGLAFGQAGFSDLLRTAIKTSGERNYHNALRPRDLHRLWKTRETAENAWKKAHGKQ